MWESAISARGVGGWAGFLQPALQLAEVQSPVAFHFGTKFGSEEIDSQRFSRKKGDLEENF